jgi:SAM-dependent methyltransferase
MMRASFDRPQVSKEHYGDGYDNDRRWSSYWIQIEAASAFKGKRVLEVGMGTGIVATYLRSIQRTSVTTLDIDLNLNPDIVADITDMPLPDQSFECAMACEVLEHLPYSDALAALREMRRVAPNAIISVPNHEFALNVSVAAGSLRRCSMGISLPNLFRRKGVLVSEQHFWELGAGKLTRKRFESDLAMCGWTIEKRIRNQAHLFHQFYVLREA